MTPVLLSLLLARSPALADDFPCASGDKSVTLMRAMDGWGREHGTLDRWFSDLPSDDQTNLFVAMPFDPPKADVKHVVFLAAGQQNFDGLDDGLLDPGLKNAVTGQKTGYKYLFPAWDDESTASTGKCSLFGRFRKAANDGAFPHDLGDDTLVVLVFDAVFDFYDSASLKTDKVDAFAELLRDQIRSDTVETFWFAGSSRGGGLAWRLAASTLCSMDPRRRPGARARRSTTRSRPGATGGPTAPTPATSSTPATTSACSRWSAVTRCWWSPPTLAPSPSRRRSARSLRCIGRRG